MKLAARVLSAAVAVPMLIVPPVVAHGAPANPPHRVAAAPAAAARQVAYITNRAANTVSAVDTATNTVARTIFNIGRDPFYMVVSPNNSKLYVGLQNDCTTTCPIQVVDLASYTFPAAPPIRIGGHPGGMAITPGGLLYVAWNDATSGTGYVAVVNTATNTVIGNIATGGKAAVGIRLSPDGSRVYTANQNTNDISYFPAGVVGPLPTPGRFAMPAGSKPGFLTITPDGRTAYVTSNLYPTSSVSVVDLTANPPAFRQSVYTGADTVGANVNADGTKVYVSTAAGVAVITTATNTVTTRVSISQSGPTLGDFLPRSGQGCGPASGRRR